MSRAPRPRLARGRSRVGDRFEVDVGPVAHGGSCVARVPEEGNRVVFIRHAIPGERVVVELTEGTDGDRFWRGDAVQVLAASPDRVTPACPVAGPGQCGGCDFQHVALPRQRELKADVVREQLARLARLERPVVVEPLPLSGSDDGLRWRTRMRWAVTADGGRGLRAHRSQRVVAVEECLIAHPGARAVGDSPAPVVETVVARAGTHRFRVGADGFWQVHPAAPAALVDAVLGLLAPAPGERVLDLYAGVGLFARFLADAVGPSGRVVAVEGDRDAAGHARDNLAGVAHTTVARGQVSAVLAGSHAEPFDLVVLDPPRQGARRQVVGQVAERAPRAVAYVACDPAALARDLTTFAEHGYRLAALRAFDAFPMTSHVECVAHLVKSDSGLR